MQQLEAPKLSCLRTVRVLEHLAFGIRSDGFTCMILSKAIIKNCLIVLWLFFFSSAFQ